MSRLTDGSTIPKSPEQDKPKERIIDTLKKEENISNYWQWRINEIKGKLMSRVILWDEYESKLEYLKKCLEEKQIPQKQTGDLTTYYYWKKCSNPSYFTAPSEQYMKAYYDNMSTRSG